MKLIRKTGATSNILQIFIADSTSTTGAGLTGLTNASAGLTAYYHRDTDTTATAISLVTMTVGTFTSGGFKEIDSTNMPGWYQFCPPDAALASGAKSVGFLLKGATNMAPLPIEIDLWAVDPQDATAFGVSRIDAAVSSRMATFTLPTNFSSLAITAGGAVTAGTVNDKTGYSLSVTPPTSAQIATAVWQDTTAGDFTVASSIGKSLYTSGNAPGAASGLALVGSNMGTATSVTGSVGSVTGAVGSVTGNVGGNVAGSVASVTNPVAITSNRKKGSSSTVEFTMQDSTTGADKTGLTVAAVISKDGGVFAGATNLVTEIANGWYQLVLTATEMNANNILLQLTATGAVNRDIWLQTQP